MIFVMAGQKAFQELKKYLGQGKNSKLLVHSYFHKYGWWVNLCLVMLPKG